MVNDIQDEFEIPEDELMQEDTNKLDDVPVYKQLNQKFHEPLTAIFKFLWSVYKNSILIYK